jgi:hypothetical protein
MNGFPLSLADGIRAVSDKGPAFKVSGRDITLGGLLEKTEGSFDGTPTTVAVLPARRSQVVDDGARPLARRVLPVVGAKGEVPQAGYLTVDVDGSVVLTIDADWVSLDGVHVAIGL